MELIGSCAWLDYSVEAYSPKPGMEDVWVIWVVRGERVVHEVKLWAEVTAPYGIAHSLPSALNRAAEQALRAAVRKAESGDDAS